MSDDLSRRRLNISVRDEHGELIAGSRIAFEIEGSTIGVVEDSDGHGNVIRPADDERPTTVTVTHAGETKSALIAFGQNHHTFTFQKPDKEAEAVPQRTDARRPLLMVGGLSAVAAVAVALVVIPRSDGRSTDSADLAARGIAERCAGGRTVLNESDITAGLSAALTQLQAGAKVTSSDVGAVTANLTPTEGGIEFYKVYTSCLKQETESYLRLRGVPVQTSPAPEPSSVPATSQRPRARQVSEAELPTRGLEPPPPETATPASSPLPTPPKCDGVSADAEDWRSLTCFGWPQGGSGLDQTVLREACESETGQEQQTFASRPEAERAARALNVCLAAKGTTQRCSFCP